MYIITMAQTTKMTSEYTYCFETKKEVWEWLRYWDTQYPFVLNCIIAIEKQLKKTTKNVFHEFFW